MERSEHPNPQFRRENFTSLNGEWEFEIGKGDRKGDLPLSSLIRVPFCPESKLSGVGNTDFIYDCTYAKTFTLSERDLKERLVLHFGAVDYEAVVFVNGREVCRHRGGYTPFEADIAPYAQAGENRIVVRVHDDVTRNQPTGKQSDERNSHGCFYTRTTGIWQSVWLERTPVNYVRSVRFFPDAEKGALKAEINTEGGGRAKIRVLYQGREAGVAEKEIYYRGILKVSLSEKHLWEIGAGRLYDVEITFGEDKVYSYFGLRSVGFEGRKFLLNGKSVFQRLVLDQGYYSDGIYTAPSVEAMQRDIRIARELGFNGARLHQKLFEPEFLYECDKAGYLVWGEFPSWGVEYENLNALGQFVAEWTEAVSRDFNHPSVVIWCPLNETWENLSDKKKIRDVRFVEAVYHVTKTLDPTRPCVDVSGGYHGRYTDLFDVHCYYEPERFLKQIEAIEERNELTMEKTFAPPEAEEDIPYNGVAPLNVSEYGGVSFVATDSGWGYHAADTEEAFLESYLKNTEAILNCGKISGFCYTQLYDVEQEQNGLYTYGREKKFSDEGMRKIAACNRKTAAIEKI